MKESKLAAERLELEVSRELSREEAIEVLRRLRRPLPVEFKFDRVDANQR
jgi:hypothetical protein